MTWLTAKTPVVLTNGFDGKIISGPPNLLELRQVDPRIFRTKLLGVSCEGEPICKAILVFKPIQASSEMGAIRLRQPDKQELLA